MAGSINELRMQLDTYLEELEATQGQMVILMDQQQLSLTSPDPAEILEFGRRESLVLDAFRGLIERRAGLLAQAHALGYSVQTLEQLSRLLADPTDSRPKQFQRLKTRGSLLNTASQAQWVACQKASLHCRQLIQLVANRGRNTLPSASGKPISQGGAILDASV